MTENILELYLNKIKEAEELAHPRVLINICSHGNEILGLQVKKLFDDLNVIKGSFTFNLANPEAVAQHKRYLESDLNRSFPGNENGTLEEKIASQLMKYIPLFDYVFDIHSTESDLKNCLVIEDNLLEIQQIINVCKNAETVLYIPATSGTSIFTACRLKNKIIPGLAFEYGDNSDETAKRTFDDLSSILNMLGIMESTVKVVLNQKRAMQFECYKVFPKNFDDVLSKNIINYHLVLKGDTVAHSAKGETIIAPEDFYPVLFGEPNYTTIFGFMAKKME